MEQASTTHGANLSNSPVVDISGTTNPALAVPQNDFDEYGAELGPEARVWKTYVREADKFDGEKVDEWNKSLDVILIFAALFSAISTAFVMDSSKKLQEDPAERAAYTLTLISQTLLVMANNTQSLALPDLGSSSNKHFSPTKSAICVNILWFLSLSLSVAVSLIAMLAKEWCHSFISGRTGHPCSQARRRQQRWNGVTQWKMPELLVVLPSLIHLALLLFAIGLSIYLWDIHFAVALPVVIVTTSASGVYVASTVLPLLFEHCPYSTTISRFIRTLYKAVTHSRSSGEDYGRQELATSQALGWAGLSKIAKIHNHWM